MARPASPRSWTPWTGLLFHVIDKDHRARNARRLINTLAAWVAVILLATVAVFYMLFALVPVASLLPAVGGGAGTLLVGAATRTLVRRYRHRRDGQLCAVEPENAPPSDAT